MRDLQFSGLIKIWPFEEFWMLYLQLFWKPPCSHYLLSVSERVKMRNRLKILVCLEIISTVINTEKSGSFPTTFHFYALLIPSGPRRKAVKFSLLTSLHLLSQSWKGNPVAKAMPEVCPTKKTSANQWDYFEVLIQIESGNFYAVLAHPQSLTLQWHKHDTVHPVAVFLLDWWLKKGSKLCGRFWMFISVGTLKKEIRSLWRKKPLTKPVHWDVP